MAQRWLSHSFWPRAHERGRRKFHYTTSQPICQEKKVLNFCYKIFPKLNKKSG